MYKDIFEKSTDGMLIIENNKFIECNAASLKMLQYESKEQLLNIHPSEISPEFQADGQSSFEKANKMNAQTFETGSNTFEWIHTRFNGEEFWVEVVLTDISKDEKAMMLVTWREIGEKKGLEEELKRITEGKVEKLKERMELALLGNNDGIWDWNTISNEVYYSPRWKEMIGYENHELSSDFSSWQDNLHPDDLESSLKCIEKHMIDETEYFELEHRLKHKDGTWVWILARGKKILDENNNIVRMIGTHTDISAQKKIEQELKDSKQYFKAIYEGHQDGIAILDEESNFLEVNPAYIKMTSMSEVELLSTSCVALSAPEDVERSIAVINEVVSVGYVKNYEKRCNFDNQDPIDVAMSLSLLHNPRRILISVRDVTQKKIDEKKMLEHKEILHHQAHHDALTGLPNRVLFKYRLENAIEKAKRNHTMIAVFFIDLDHFKEINDSLGHNVGDEVLKVVSHRLKDAIRDEDTLARIGGDEFTILLEGIQQIEDASLIASKVLDNLSKIMEIDYLDLYVSSSIGISIYPNDGLLCENLLKYADSAMYKAKNNGRNNFQFYSADMTESAFERVVMETSLRTALVNEEFVVYYQPQVNAKTNTLTGMEALVRWKHSTIGIISPAKFMPLAESTGLIVKIDRYVMKTAMEQLVQWYEKGLNPGVLAMNLSVKQLEKEDCIEAFKNLLKDTGCKPEWIELEVTEGEVMKEPQKAVELLTKISELGIELAIDDFGTGYSSLAYLKRLPIDKLKIDKAFIDDLPNGEEDAAITRAVIALAKSLNLRIIAEGVETKEQKDFLVANDCENIQGYLYSKPIPANEFETLLRKGLNL